MPVDISAFSFQTALKHHHAYDSNTWRKNIRHKLVHSKTGRKWTQKSKLVSIRQSCAVRVSIALYRAGVRFEDAEKTWTRPSGAIYPSSAGEYPNLLSNGEVVESPDPIQGRVGVIHFGRHGTDHITLWDAHGCHFGNDDDYFSDAHTVTFWKMRSS